MSCTVPCHRAIVIRNEDVVLQLLCDTVSDGVWCQLKVAVGQVLHSHRHTTYLISQIVALSQRDQDIRERRRTKAGGKDGTETVVESHEALEPDPVRNRGGRLLVCRTRGIERPDVHLCRRH